MHSQESTWIPHNIIIMLNCRYSNNAYKPGKLRIPILEFLVRSVLDSGKCFVPTSHRIMLHKWCAEQNRQLLHYSTKPYGSAKYVGHCISSLRVAAPSPFLTGRVRLHVGYCISSLVFKESPGGNLLITVLMLNCANKFIYLQLPVPRAFPLKNIFKGKALGTRLIYLWMVQRTWYFYDMA